MFADFHFRIFHLFLKFPIHRHFRWNFFPFQELTVKDIFGMFVSPKCLSTRSVLLSTSAWSSEGLHSPSRGRLFGFWVVRSVRIIAATLYDQNDENPDFHIDRATNVATYHTNNQYITFLRTIPLLNVSTASSRRKVSTDSVCSMTWSRPLMQSSAIYISTTIAGRTWASDIRSLPWHIWNKEYRKWCGGRKNILPEVAEYRRMRYLCPAERQARALQVQQDNCLQNQHGF